MITDDTLAELDAAERAATKAGWQTHLRNPFSIDCEVSILTETGGTLFRSTSYGKMRQDGDFIALSRNHMRELLDDHKRLRAELVAARDALGWYAEPSKYKRHKVPVTADMLDRNFDQETEVCAAECDAGLKAVVAIKRIDDSGLLGEGK